jgi:hypothetical protein
MIAVSGISTATLDVRNDRVMFVEDLGRKSESQRNDVNE